MVDADLGLAGGDLRAAERTVQLLHQVAGRAGRAEAPGRVLLQTFSPEHPVMQALVRGRPGGVHGQRGGAAPAGPLAALRPAGGADRQRGHGRRRRTRWRAIWARRRRTARACTVLGPAPAPLAILRGRHRRRLLLKTRRDIAVQPILREWLAQVTVPRGGAGGCGCRSGVVSVGGAWLNWSSRQRSGCLISPFFLPAKLPLHK